MEVKKQAVMLKKKSSTKYMALLDSIFYYRCRRIAIKLLNNENKTAFILRKLLTEALDKYEEKAGLPSIRDELPEELKYQADELTTLL